MVKILVVDRNGEFTEAESIAFFNELLRATTAEELYVPRIEAFHPISPQFPRLALFMSVFLCPKNEATRSVIFLCPSRAKMRSCLLMSGTS